MDELPRWPNSTGELRSRTEDQTALGLVPGKGRFYELMRARSAVMIAPTKSVKGQIEFQDTHALGLPVRDVPAKQRSTFNFFRSM